MIEGRIDLGEFVAFNAYLALLVWPTIALGWILNTLQRGLGAMERIEEILRLEPQAVPRDPVEPEPQGTVGGLGAELRPTARPRCSAT